MRETFSTRLVIAAIGALACIVYLAGGRLDIGTSATDVAFTPAMSPITQLSFATDVPNDHRLTPSTTAARFSLWIARGRRTALRDLAAVASALTIVMFGIWLHSAGLEMFPVAVAMLAMMVAPTAWSRGVSWTGDALTPALAAATLWALSRRWIVAAVVFLVAALLDGFDHFGLIAGASAEFTMLGICLITIGTIRLFSGPHRIAPALAVAAAGALYMMQLTDIPLVLGGWGAVAIAIAWVSAVMPGRRAYALVAAVAIVLVAGPSLTRIRMSALGRDLDSSLAARAAYDLRRADLAANAAVIAESRRVDSVLRLSSIPIVPQSEDGLDAALREGKTLIAFPDATANLERLGFLFERGSIGSTSVSIVAGRTPCVALAASEWRDVSLLAATGSFVLHGATYGAAPGGAMIHITQPQPARVTSIEPRSISFEIENDGGLTALHVPSTGRDDAVIVQLERAPVAAVAKADDANVVRMCSGRLRSPLMLGPAANASAQVRMDESGPFVAGWHPVEADPDLFRWTAAPDAILGIAIAPAGPVRVTVTATPAARAAQHPAIALRVNGCRLASQSMHAGQGDYEWTAGGECWKDGMNQVAISISPLISPASLFATHDTRLLGARIGAVRLARMP